MESFRSAVRALRSRPGSSALIVLALGLGIGANCALFTVVNGLLLRSFPFDRPAELVELTPPAPDMQSVDGPERFVAFVFNIAGESRFGYKVSPRLFEVLGVRPILGTGFEGGAPQVALSYDYWRRTSGDPAIVGTAMTISAKSYTIVGVMPAGFGLISRDGNVFVRDSEFSGGRSIARLKAGVTVETARTELERLVRGRAQVVPISRAYRRDNAGSLLLLQSAVLLVLLITCANAGTLRLSANLARRREFAIRTAVGASRGQLISQQMIESAILAGAGCALGLGVALASLGPLERALPASISRFLLGEQVLSIDANVFGFSAALALTAMLVAGLPAALSSLRFDVMSVLRDSARGSGPGRQRMAQGIVAAEIAVAVVLATAAGLSLKSVARLEAADLGFSADQVLRAMVDVKPAALGPLVARVEALPGVEHVGLVAPQVFPFGGPLVRGARFAIDGRPDTEARAELYTANPAYFRAIRLPLLRGRLFDRTEPAPVVLVSDVVARRHWPDGGAVGAVIRFGEGPAMTVIGVVGDVRNPVGADVQPTAYRPLAPGERGAVTLMIRTANVPMALAAALEAEVRAIDATAPRPRTADLETEVGAYLTPQRFTASLFGGFAIAGLLLAALGVYGVTQVWTRMRMPEFGVRLALGARPVNLMTIVLRSAARVCAWGVGVGLAGAFLAGRAIESELYGLDSADPWVFGVTTAVLTFASLAAAVAPAWRATKADPLAALKRE